MITVGIDPGVKGAVAVIEDDCVADVFTMPVRTNSKGKKRVDGRALYLLLPHFTSGWRPVNSRFNLIVERVRAMPRRIGDKEVRMGAQSSFQFGESYGVCKTAAELAFGVDAYEVEAAVWKRRAGLLGEDKDASFDLALKLFHRARKYLTIKRGELNKEQAIGRAEAMLIAKFGRPLEK